MSKKRALLRHTVFCKLQKSEQMNFKVSPSCSCLVVPGLNQSSSSIFLNLINLAFKEQQITYYINS